MLSSEEILSGLAHISNTYREGAMLWHGILYMFLIFLLFVRRPSNRTIAILGSLPLFSVSVLAWISGNPFNGTVFLLFAALLMSGGIRLDRNPVTPGKKWQVATGVVLLVFGLIYPHFLETGSSFTYLYAAPVGLIPCPTLSVVIGLALLFNGFQSWRWAATLAIPGLFYGIFGIFRLGVWLDSVLLAGTLALLATAFALRPHEATEMKTVF